MLPTQLDTVINSDPPYICINCINNYGSLVSLDFARADSSFEAFIYLSKWAVTDDEKLISSSEWQTNEICRVVLNRKLLRAKYSENRLTLVFDSNIEMVIEPEMAGIYDSGSRGDDMADFFFKEIGQSITLNSLRGFYSEPL